MTHSSEGLPAREKTKVEILQEDFCDIFGDNKKSEALELSKKLPRNTKLKIVVIIILSILKNYCLS